MKVTVIIPVYNRKNLIAKCLDSCINQTMSKEFYEIIIVDDCSTDGTYEIANEYRNNYPNFIRLLRMEKNSGSASAPRNAGLDAVPKTGGGMFFF